MMQYIIVVALALILTSCAGLENTPIVFGMKTDNAEYEYSSKGGLSIKANNVNITEDGVAIVVDRRSGK